MPPLADQLAPVPLIQIGPPCTGALRCAPWLVAALVEHTPWACPALAVWGVLELYAHVPWAVELFLIAGGERAEADGYDEKEGPCVHFPLLIYTAIY